MSKHAPRRAARGALIALGVAGAAFALAALTASAVATFFARSVVTPPRRKEQELRVLGLDTSAGTVTLGAEPDTLLPGRYGLWVNDAEAHLRFGEVLRQDAHTVTRQLLRIDYGEIEVGMQARLNGWFYLDPVELGLPWRTVQLDTELGSAPAWYFPAEKADSGHWVIQIHGRAVERAETLRAIPVFHELGYHALAISYRNDPDAPASPDGLYRLGLDEWRDAEAAVQYALDQGADSIVVMGWSMGGAIALQLALNSELADRIDALVLESPVVNWVDTLRYQAESYGLPAPLREGVYGLVSQPWGRVLTGAIREIDLNALDLVERGAELRHPTLILHSDDDGFVPAGPSRELAAARPDLVSLVSFDEARHVKLWNYDEERWGAAIRGWLRSRGLAG